MPPTLVRPQTFTVFQQPDSASPAVRLESFILTSWLEYFTCSNTCEQNLIYSLIEVLIARHFVARVPLVKESVEVADLVFVYTTIVQRFKTFVFEDFDRSNSGCYISSGFPECLSPGETPGVYTARPIGYPVGLQQEER